MARGGKGNFLVRSKRTPDDLVYYNISFKKHTFDNLRAQIVIIGIFLLCFYNAPVIGDSHEV